MKADDFTRTVDGAAGYESKRTWAEWFEERPTNAQLMREEIEAEHYRVSDDEQEDVNEIEKRL